MINVVMTMEVGEKSKRDDDDSPVSTGASLTWNSSDPGNSDSIKNPEDLTGQQNNIPQSPHHHPPGYHQANDPAIEEQTQLQLRPSPSRSDTADEDDVPEDEKGASPITDDTDGVDKSESRSEDVDEKKNKEKEKEEEEEEEEVSKNHSKDVFSEPVTPQQPLTFTINFDDDKEVDTARYRNLFERYNARHRRNLSTSKVEMVQSVKHQVSSGDPQAPVLSPNSLFQRQKEAPSTNSEGYFSSDQDDDTRRKADQLSRKLKQLGLKSSSKVPAVPERGHDPGLMSRSYTERSSSYNNSKAKEELEMELSHSVQVSPTLGSPKIRVKSSARENYSRREKTPRRGEMSLDLEKSHNRSIQNGDNNVRRKINAFNQNGSNEYPTDYDLDETITPDHGFNIEKEEEGELGEGLSNFCTTKTSRDKSFKKNKGKGVFTEFGEFGDNIRLRRDDGLLSSGSSVGSENHFVRYSSSSAVIVNKVRSVRMTDDDDDRYNANCDETINLEAIDVSNFDDHDAEDDDDEDGAVSEAGTYTIHKDYTDEEKARMDIDRVFSVGVVTEEESSEAYVHSFKMSISRENNWISEWATQVAEHNSLPSSAIGGREVISKGLISPQSPQSPSKIPSPIHSRSRRLSRGRQEQSDSSLETESYLRTKAPTATSPCLNNDRVLVDSGGESDDDTSRSHNTPPHSLQRVGSARRASLSDVLFARNSVSEGRRSARNYSGADSRLRKDRIVTLQEPLRSPTHVLARLQLGRRNSSLDRKEYASDTAESNCTSGRSSLKGYLEGTSILPGSPLPTRLRTNTPKLTTNSPILSRKEIAPSRPSELAKTPLQAKNIGYFTCTENSPYMLRKSSSTASYCQRDDFNHRERSKEPFIPSVQNLHQNSPVPRRSTGIQRSSSNASVRNPQVANLLARRSSFSNNNNTLNDRTAIAALPGKFNAASDSSSEAGDKPLPKSPVPPVSSGIKLNRAFSIRRARLTCEYETTPSTTPEERRRKAQVSDTRSGQVPTSSRQTSSFHRGRSVGNPVTSSKDTFKRIEQPKPRAPSMSRTDSGRISTRAPKNVNHVQHSRPNQKPTKDAHKKPGRSNSTLTSKEVEFQNWKRRKNYDPMKAAAQGKKKLDTSKKQHSIEDSARGCESSVLRSASFHGTGGTLSLAADWSDNDNEFTDSNEYIRPPPPSSPQLGSDSDFETSSYLRTTENVVSAMSARMVVRHPPPVDSGGESDEDTSRSLHRPTHRGSLHPSRGSDTESSDEPRQAIVQSPVTSSNHGKVIPSGLRKARIEPRDKKISTSLSKPRSSPRDARGITDTTRVVARTDSGRFSTRLPKNQNAVAQSKTKENKKTAVPSSKEVEMQNWKRRKSYDPMKAAMEGRRKVNQTKRSPNMNLSPSHVLRSQSFHGSVGLGVSDWSDEELTVSADEASLY